MGTSPSQTLDVYQENVSKPLHIPGRLLPDNTSVRCSLTGPHHHGSEEDHSASPAQVGPGQCQVEIAEISRFKCGSISGFCLV